MRLLRPEESSNGAALSRSAGSVNGESYRAILVPRGGGRHRLYLNGEIMPMPAELAVKWFFSGLAQAVLLGIVTSLVYKPEPSSAP
jgi:hypothetical protein